MFLSYTFMATGSRQRQRLSKLSLTPSGEIVIQATTVADSLYIDIVTPASIATPPDAPHVVALAELAAGPVNLVPPSALSAAGEETLTAQPGVWIYDAAQGEPSFLYAWSSADGGVTHNADDRSGTTLTRTRDTDLSGVRLTATPVTTSGGVLPERAVSTVVVEAAPWTVASLFAGGGKGFWLDERNLSFLKQDVGGTTAASSSGDPVGYAAPAAGHGVTALVASANDASRPTLYIDSDGRASLSFAAALFQKLSGPIAGVSQQDWTAAALVYVNGAQSTPCDVLSAGSPSIMAAPIRLSNAGTWEARGTANSGSIVGPAFTTGAWWRLIARRTGGTLEIFASPSAETPLTHRSKSAGASSNILNVDLMIGLSVESGKFFSGRVRQAIWLTHRAATDEEISAIDQHLSGLQ